METCSILGILTVLLCFAVNDGKIDESVMFTDFSEVFGPGSGLPLNAGDQIRSGFVRQLLEIAQSTKKECRQEIQNVLGSLAMISEELSRHCSVAIANETEFQLCRQRKRDRMKEYVWAAKIVNAWGTPSPGLMIQGQFLWYGSHYQCVNSKVHPSDSGIRSARYCLINVGPSFEEWAYAGDEGHNVRIQLGACLPPSCVEYDSSEFLSSILNVLANTSADYSWKLRGALSRHEIFCQPKRERLLNFGQFVVVALFSVLVVLVIAGTSIDYWVEKQKEQRRSEKRVQRLIESVSDIEGSFNTAHTTVSFGWLDLESVMSFKSQESLRRNIRQWKWWFRWIRAFSIRLNIKGLASSQKRTVGSRITCLYGIRVLSMVWIIVGHAYIFGMPQISNLVEAMERIPAQFLSQLILNSSLSVDTFFMISGLLNCYVWCVRHKKDAHGSTPGIASWLAYYGHRYIRLIPPYVLVIAFVVSGLYSALGDGPQWRPARISGIQCDKDTWWRHLLFVNNLIPGGEHCLHWMWQLAIDVQCYVVAPLFIIAFWKRPKLGYALIIVVVLMSSLARGLVVGIMRLPTNLMLFLPSERFRNDYHVYFDMIYQKPYFRCGPYFVGILTGWLMAMKADPLRERMNSWKWKYVVWFMIFGFCAWPIFGLYPMMDENLFSPGYNGFFAAASRTLWSIGVAMVVVSCNYQCDSYLNSVLSWIGWWPFARLTYGVYLVHELLIIFVYYGLHSPIQYDGHVTMLAYSAFFTAISYGISLGLFIIAEGPALAAERLLFRRKPGSEKKINENENGNDGDNGNNGDSGNNGDNGNNGNNGNNRDNGGQSEVQMERQTMTARWSEYAAAGESGPSPSGVELYEEKKHQLDGGEEETSTVKGK